MKKIICIIGIFSLVLWGCEDMNSVNQDWIDRGEIIYTGAVDSLEIRPGNNRLWLVWEMNADPRISELIISWNNKRDSLVLPVVRDTEEKIGIHKDSVLIDKNLEEGVAVFQLYTRDNEGHSSIVREITADVYGDNYAEATSYRMPRKITSMNASDETGRVELTFEKLDATDVLYTELIYTSYENSPEGEQKMIRIDNSTLSLELEYVSLGDGMDLQSMHVPTPDAIDVFPGKKVVTRLPRYYLLDQDRWASVYRPDYENISKEGWTGWASTEESGGDGPGAEGGRVGAIFDDNLDSFWHSAWRSTTPALPHIIELDMKAPQTFQFFEFVRRLGNSNLKTVIIEMSVDSQNWDSIGSMTFGGDGAENTQVFLFPNPVTAQYIRIKVTESNSGRHASIAEIAVGTKR